MNVEDIFDLSNQRGPIKIPTMVAGGEQNISSAPLITPEKAKSILTGIAEFGANLGPGGGITDAAGLAANPFGEGKLPSFGENVLDTIAQFKQGNYVSGASKGLESALQALGTAGDTVQMAGIASGLGAIPALAIGAGMKLPLNTQRFFKMLAKTGLDSIKTIPTKGEYAQDFTNLVKSFQEERPDIYNAATKMMNNNKLPEEDIAKMITARLKLVFDGKEWVNPAQKNISSDPQQRNLNAIPVEYNTEMPLEKKIDYETPLHYRSEILTNEALANNPDGIKGSDLYNLIKNANLKDGGIKDKELNITGLNVLKNSDEIFKINNVDQMSNLTDKFNQNKVVSRNRFLNDIPHKDRGNIDGRDQMYNTKQRIGGERLAQKESLDYGIVTLNDQSDFKGTHEFKISPDDKNNLMDGHIAWARTSVRKHPNGKKYLVIEEMQSDRHTKAKGTSEKPGVGYRPDPPEMKKLFEKANEASGNKYDIGAIIKGEIASGFDTNNISKVLGPDVDKAVQKTEELQKYFLEKIGSGKTNTNNKSFAHSSNLSKFIDMFERDNLGIFSSLLTDRIKKYENAYLDFLTENDLITSPYSKKINQIVSDVVLKNPNFTPSDLTESLMFLSRSTIPPVSPNSLADFAYKTSNAFNSTNSQKADELFDLMQRNKDNEELLGAFPELAPESFGNIQDRTSASIRKSVNKGMLKKLDEYSLLQDKAMEAHTKAQQASDAPPHGPLDEQFAWTKALSRNLLKVAADKGLDGVVLPNSRAYINAGGRGKYDWDPSVEKGNTLQKGYEKTTIPAFKSVAKEFGLEPDTITWEGWHEFLNNTHSMIPVNQSLSKISTRAYKEGGRVSLLDNINIFDLGESLYG